MYLKIKDYDIVQKEVDNKKVDNIKHERIIPITSDCMFKNIFGREDHKQFPCKLLSYIIDMSYEELFKCLKFTKNETGKEKRGDLAYRNDLVLDINGNIINVEMNNNSSEDIRNRNISYLMRLREDKKDKKYPQVIQINLNNYSYKDDNEVVRIFSFSSKDNVILTNLIFVVDIYLPNIMKKSYNESVKELNELERFLLVGLEENKAKSLKYIGEDNIMKELEEKMEEWTLSEDLRESYDKEWALKDQALRDGYEQGKEEGREKGIEEGIKEGIEQGIENTQYDIVKNMLSKELTIEEISDLTNISIEKINEIKEMN